MRRCPPPSEVFGHLPSSLRFFSPQGASLSLSRAHSACRCRLSCRLLPLSFCSYVCSHTCTHHHVHSLSRVLVVMMNSTMRAGASPMPPAFLSFLRPSISFLPSVVLLASRTRWFSLVLSPRARSACCLSCRLLPLSARMMRVLSCSFFDSLSYTHPVWASALQPHTYTITHSHTLLITCTCCDDPIKGTQDKDFSYSFSDSLLLIL